MIKYRLELTKGEEIRYISHLDYAELIRRAVLRAKLPVAYSEGFNPHLKMTFLAALALGITSSGEYMDIELKEELSPFDIGRRLVKNLPPSVLVTKVRKINPAAPLRKAQPDYAVYQITAPLRHAADAAALKAAVAAFNEAPTAVIHRVTPKKKQTFDAKEFLAGPILIETQPPDKEKTPDDKAVIRLNIRLTPNGSVKPNEILSVLKDEYAAPLEIEGTLTHRLSLLCRGKSPIACI